MKESYRRRVVKAGRTLDISCTYPTRFGDKLTRSRRRNPTAESMRVYNEELAVRRLTLILNENFKPDDWWVTLHYERHKRPASYDAAQEVIVSFIPKLRRLYRAEGEELKAVKCTAFGERGAVHHHLVINRGVSPRKITALWKEHIHASIDARPPCYVALYESGEYSGVAGYILQQKQTVTGERPRGVRKWSGTQNLRKPQAISDRRIEKFSWQEPPAAPAGYFVDTDSIRAGCNPVNGRPYLFYRCIRIDESFSCYGEDGKRLSGKEAVKYYRQRNREQLKKSWIDLNPEGEVVFRQNE